MITFAHKKSVLALALVWGALPGATHALDVSDNSAVVAPSATERARTVTGAPLPSSTPAAIVPVLQSAPALQSAPVRQSAPALRSAPVRQSAPPAPTMRYVLQRPNPEPKEAGAGEPGMAEADRLATEAVKLMREGKLKEASASINAALRLRLDRSYYHLVNGLIYHLQARTGEHAAFDLAQQGYKQAINFDSSNWQAHYFAGLLSIDTSKFEVARQQLADAVYLHPDDPGVLSAFAYAAYRSGAPDQAAGAINAMEAMGGAQTAVEMRNAAVIMAAVGENQRAQSYLDRLKTISDERQSSYVERRVQEWRDIHRRPGIMKTQFQAGAAPAPAPGSDDAAAALGAVPDAAVAGAPGLGDATASGSFPGDALGVAVRGGPPLPPTAPGTESKMVVVDVVLISTEEDFANGMGVNLLRGLQIQFGGGVASPFAYQRVSTNTGTDSSTTSIVRNLTIPSVNYSLNIFNSNNARDEILARPTLVATAGRTSEFFSGEELNAVVVNSSNNSSASPVSIQKEIGTSLSVTPSFFADGRIMLKVVAQRTFIRTPNANLTGFDARVETSKSKVDASVVMRPGETLILGGLSEKEGEKTRDGVPLLQDVPMLQYLFARSTTRDYQKSMLILVTPRPPQYVYQPEKARQEYEQSLTEDERPFANLRARYADWFRPYPNWASVFHHLQENSLWREFRTGDVVLENWSDMRSLKDRLNKVLDFLYF